MAKLTTSILDRKDFKDAIRFVIEEKIPFCKLLGLKLGPIDPFHPEITLDMRDDLLGNFSHGMLHGGVIASILDSVAGYAIFLKLIQEEPKIDLMAQLHDFARISTIDLRIDFLQPGRGDHFIATAEVTRLGKRIANVQMRLQNEQDICIATGAAAFIVHVPKNQLLQPV